MKQLFVASDIHNFFDEFIEALNEADYDKDNPEHILLICGDLFDRGKQANELLEYLLSIPEERLILIRGNHEDLFDDCLSQIKDGYGVDMHHISNGTLDTISQLTGIDSRNLRLELFNLEYLEQKLKPYYKLTNRMLNYYETKTHIFVHGFIPCIDDDLPAFWQEDRKKKYIENWREANDKMWQNARWINGIRACFEGLNETGKTIVCGHWHCSAGWTLLNPNKYEDFGDKANFNPFINHNLCAIDGCTAYSGKVNVIKIPTED